MKEKEHALKILKDAVSAKRINIEKRSVALAARRSEDFNLIERDRHEFVTSVQNNVIN